MVQMLIFIIILIIAIIAVILLAKHQLEHNGEKGKNSYFENKFTQIQDNIIKEARDNYNNIYSKISTNSKIINCNGILYWIKDNTLYSIIQWDVYAANIEKKLAQEKYSVVYNSKIPEINFTYDEIPIKDIKYFTKEGDVEYNTVVSGGGGGGSSIAGAIIGGVLAGGAGAIIGSRVKNEEIKSDIVENDVRKTILKYYKNFSLISQEYDYQVFDVFEELIPDKEYNIVLQNEIQKNTKSPNDDVDNNDVDIEDSLKKLKNLREKELIDESEYQQKKKELLDML